MLILQVVLPLLLSLSCSLKNNFRFNFIATTISCLFGALNSILIAVKIAKYDSPLKYNLGNWPKEYGIEISLDFFGAFLIALIWIVTFSAFLYGINSIKNIQRSNLFCSLLIICTTGMTGIIATNDVFNLYVFLEITSLSSYAVIAAFGNKRSFVTAFEYLIIGTLAATFYLIGVGFLYSATGTLNMQILSEQITRIAYNKTVSVGIIFVVISLLIKSAVFPFHFWITKVYCNSSGIVAVFLSGTSTKVAIYALIKFIYYTIGQSIIFDQLQIDSFVKILSFSAIFTGAISAILANDIKKILTYSSVSQIGYIMLAVCTDSKFAILVAFLQIIAHSLSKSSMFIIADFVKKNGSTKSLKPYILLNSLSLLGIPLTAGFIGKFYFFDITLKSGEYFLFAMLCLSSLLTAFYLWSFCHKACSNIQRAESNAPHAPLALLAGLNILFAVFASNITLFI